MEKQHWKRSFFTIWSGQSISLITSMIVQYAIVWWLTDKTGSATVLATAMLVGFVPQGIIGLFAGVIVDRYSRKTIMILSDSAIALACLAIAIVGFFGEIPIWLVMAVLFIRSIGSAFHQPALQASIPLLVPEDMLAKCNGYSQTLTSVSVIASPAIAALLYATMKLNAILLLDVAGALVGVLAIVIVRIPELKKEQAAQTPHFLREMKEGMSVLYRLKGLFGLSIIGALFMVVFMPVNSLFPLMSMGYFQGTAWHASIVEMAFGVGMTLGSLAIGAWGGFKDKVFSIFLSMLSFGVLLTAGGLLPPGGFALFAALSGVMGLIVPLYSAPYMTLMQEKVAPEYLGRVLSLTNAIMTVASPVGLALSGVFAEAVGINVYFAVSGAITALISLLCMVVPSVRTADKKPVMQE